MNKSRNIFGSIRNNKWMAAFIATAIALVAAITVAIILGVTPKPDPEPEYFEGDEAGIYYYDVADGEILLTLSGGNRFTIAGPQINKTGTYTIDAEGNIVLDYIRDEDGTENAKLSGNTLALQKGDASLPFLKKVNYTVTFNVGSDSSATTATVTNGKTVAKPADPTKDGYAFLGWYSDGDFKNAFDFSSTIITDNVTLYARWVHDEVGVGKYTIDFDLGSYEGAPAYDDIKTIAGLAYDVPTPTREGYIFGGWWVSMYEDGEKLSYEYTESTTFNADTTLYAVWYQESSEKLSSPLVSINKNTIKWNPVAGATVYEAVITDSEGNEVHKYSGGATTFNFNFDESAAGDYVISVVAVAQNAANNSDATVRYIANKALAKVSQFQVVDGILIYNAVNNATTYYVSVECGNPAHKHTNFDNGISTSFSLMNCPMQEGGIKITVTAKANGYASSVSETYVYNKVLDAITNVVYNAQVDAFVWNAVPAATSYTVTVTVGDKTYTVDNGLKTSFPVAGYTGEITVAVKPVNNGYNSPAATTATCTKVSPAMPTNVTISGMTVSWDAAEGAESYMIKIGNNAPIAVNGTSYDLATAELAAGQTYTISVMSVKGAESSAYTDTITFGYLVMNTTLTYKNNTVYWTPVIGANTYEVKVNGQVVKTVSGVCYAEVALTKEGTNTIEVRYTDVAGSAWASTDVIAYSISLYPKNDTNSVITKYYAVGDAITLPTDIVYAGYDFVDWYTSPSGAAGNGKLYKTGDIFNDHGSIALFADWTPKTYKITVSIDASYGVSNITDKSEFSATYTQGFTLPVPDTQANESLMFAGWYTGPAGTGEKLADENGNSVANYPFTRDTVAYPFFRVILSYVLQPDDTYAVKRGPDFDSAEEVTIPVSYQGKPVTTVLENAFASKRNLVKINIPDTIELIGIGAFTGCSALEYINIYKVEGTHEIHYESDNGALIHYDGETVYLEVVPRNMKGDNGVYTMSDKVQYIPNKAFQYSQLDKVVIGKNVINIAKYAFYICSHVQSFEFAEGRTQPVAIEAEAFHQCNGVTSLKLPKAFSTGTDSLTKFLDHFKKLTTIETESGGQYKAIYGNTLLANDTGTELVYVPLATSDDFTVPAGISTINDKVFSGRTLITKITIPGFVTSIGSEAFAGCSSVRTIEFEGDRMNDLTIGSKAFAGLTSLTTVTFKANTIEEAGSITIGAEAFIPSSSGTALTNLVFEDGVQIAEIGNGAFANQSKLNPFTVGTGTVVAKIGDSAFTNNSAIINLTIPAGVLSVGENAFANCANLSEVVVAEGANDITLGDNAFQNCKSLRKITVSSKVTNFSGSVVTGCFALREVNVAAGNPTLYTENGVLYNSDKTKLIFYPKALILENKGKVENLLSTLTTIDASVFESNTDLVSIKIPASVSSIGSKAFSGCTALASVKFEGATPATTLKIGTNAFQDCTKLTWGANGIELPTYTTEIGNYAFSGCTGITNLTIPANVTKIGNYAFSGCSGITELAIPSKVTTIGNGAFKGIGITSLTVPTNVTTINAGAFQDCTSLATVTVTPYDAKTLALGTASTSKTTVGVFQGCTSLTSVDLGNRVTVLGNAIFKGCTAENISIDIGTKVTKIGTYAFQGVKITSITIPATVTTIYYNAFDGDVDDNGAPAGTLTAINFELGVALNAAKTNGLTLYDYAFANQPNISSITLPQRTKSIYGKTTGSASKLETYTTSTLFSGMTSLTTIDVETISGNTAKFSAKEGVLYENDTKGNPVTLLYCPAKNTGTNNSITIPKTVTYVVRGAFYDITGLTTINFEEFDTTDAKYGTPLLNIGNNTSSYSSAKTADLVNTVFGGSSTNTITTINFPSHLAVLGSYAVGRTANNVKVNFSGSTSISIAPYAFYYAKFENVEIPNVAVLGKGAFSNCSEATSISFTTTDDLVKLPANLFESCAKLASYTIPASITELSSNLFTGCKGLTNVSFESGSKLTTISSSVFKGTGLKSIDLSGCANLESIGQSAFEQCESLESVNLTGLEKLEEIKTWAFRNCTALKSFTLPASVETLGSDAIMNCTSLEEITLFGNFDGDMFKSNKFVGCSKLNKINFVNNTYYKTDSFGAVYDPEYTTIYRFPEGANATNYTIPSSVITIDNYAFAFYPGDSITLHEGIETIGNYAFYCNKFTTIRIPASVTAIGDYALSVDSSLASSDGKTRYLDIYTSKLAAVEFAPNSKLESIGKYALYSAKALTTIVLPDSVATIGEYAFSNCESLTEIIIPAALKKIPENCFRACNALTRVTLQEGLEIIGENAFQLYDEVSAEKEGTLKIVIPSSVTTIGAGAFVDNALIGEINFTEGSKCTVIGAITKDDNVTESRMLRGTSVKKIVIPASVEELPSNMFRYAAALEEVIFESSKIEVIPNNAFENCVNLKTVIFAEGLTTIGSNVFKGELSYLKSITIPASVTSIGANLFMDCTALETVTFAEGSQLKEISAKAFYGTTALETVKLPEALEKIAASAFENSSVENITLPDSLKEISESAFRNCDNITSVELYVNVESIGAYAFYDCDSLESAVPAPGLTYIGDLAFANCEKLTRAYVPYTVYEMGGNPYAGCSKVTIELDPLNEFYKFDENGILYDKEMTVLVAYPSSITASELVIPDGVNTIAPGAFAGAKMESVIFPARFGIIPENTFYGCQNLKTIVIQEGITEIGNFAFEGCINLNNVIIPNTVTYVGNYAFAGCTSLSEVSFQDKVNDEYYTLGTHIFDGCTSLTKVVLPNAWQITLEDALDCGLNDGRQNLQNPNNVQPAILNGSIPSYMFANTGIVDAILPARVTMLRTKGVFMNCASLRSVTFGVDKLSSSKAQLGADYFTGCTSLPADFAPPYGTGSGGSGSGGGGGTIIIKPTK